MVDGPPPQFTTVQELARDYDCFVLNCDGVVWQADIESGNAFEVVKWLEASGKHVSFVTNDATKTVQDFKSKMQTFNYTLQNNVYCSANTTA